MNWKAAAIKALEREASVAYDNYYRSMMAHGEFHPTTVGYKKTYDDAKAALEEAKKQL